MLEGKGPNKVGETSAPCRDLGFNGITANASTSPGTSRPKTSNPAAIASPLVNMVDSSADTNTMAFPEGTFTGEGING